MCGDDRDLIAVFFVKFAKSLLVVHGFGIIFVNDVLKRLHSSRSTAFDQQLIMMIVGIPYVKEPTVIRLDGDTKVSGGVAREGNQENLRGQSRRLSDGLKTKPTLAFDDIMERPVCVCSPLTRTISLFLHKRLTPVGRLVLRP